MSRYTKAKGRLVRRFKVNLFGQDKFDRLLERRPNAPGMHGSARHGKPSEYKKQLVEKQKLRFMFGLTERQLRNTYQKAVAMKGATGLEFLKLLERRLDNMIYRSGLAKTRSQARQMVSHGLFMMNGRRVTVPSIQVREKDVLEVREKSKSSPVFNEAKEDKKLESARWIQLDIKKLRAEVVALPEEDDLERIVDSQLIVEFYSK